MRVLSIGNLYPPYYVGGYELLNRGVVDDLRARGHEVRVLVSDRRPGPGGDELADVHRTLRSWWDDERGVVAGSPLRRLRLERDNAATLRRHLAELRPQLVLWWGMSGLSLSLLEQVRRAGIPSFAMLMDEWPSYAPETDAWLRQFAARPALGRIAARATGLPTRVDWPSVTRYLFISNTLRERLPQLGGGEVVLPGIDARFQDPRPAPPEWGGRLLSIGRIDPRKGIGTAIEALAQLPGARLSIAGDGASYDVAELKSADRARRRRGAGRVARRPAARGAARPLRRARRGPLPGHLGRAVRARAAGGDGDRPAGRRDRPRRLRRVPARRRELPAARGRAARRAGRPRAPAGGRRGAARAPARRRPGDRGPLHRAQLPRRARTDLRSGGVHERRSAARGAALRIASGGVTR